MTKCESCGAGVGYRAADGVTVICARCVMTRCNTITAAETARLEALDPDVLKTLRKARGWTQADLALALRLPVTQVSAFERGKGLPPVELVDWTEQQ